MQGQRTRLSMQVTVGGAADPEEIDAATRQLRRELLELDVDAVESAPAGEVPPGARAIDPVVIGGLVVTISNSQLFATVVAAVRTWLTRQQERSASLEIDGDVLVLKGLSSAEQSRLADEWLARHSVTSDDND